MSTQTTTAPAATPAPKVSLAIKTAVQALLRKDGELAIARDNVCNVSKAETVKHGYTKPQLTAMLLDLGLDAPRASEVAGFVFPNHANARKELDKASAINSKQVDNKKRIAKPVILALQRDKTGELTLEKALEDFKAKESLTGTRKANPPGGETTHATDKAKPKTPAEIESHLGNLICAALAYAKENGYDEADFAAVVEEHSLKYFAEEDEDETEEK